MLALKNIINCTDTFNMLEVICKEFIVNSYKYSSYVTKVAVGLLASAEFCTVIINLIPMNNSKPTVIDVRTAAEFMGGHVAGSINIPLQEIQSRMDEIQALKSPIVL